MNITSNLENSFYEDPSCGSYKIFIFGHFIGICLFLYCIYSGVGLLIQENTASTGNNTALWLSIIFFLIMIISSYTDIRDALHAIKTIRFDGKNIHIQLFFLQKKVFNLKELKAIHDFKIIKLIVKTKILSDKKTGFFIEFNNEKKFRVSPNMQNFAALKQQLLEIIEKNNKPVLQKQMAPQ